MLLTSMSVASFVNECDGFQQLTGDSEHRFGLETAFRVVVGKVSVGNLV